MFGLTDGIIYISFLNSPDPNVQQYLDVFNWHFSVVVQFSVIAALLGLLYRLITRA